MADTPFLLKPREVAKAVRKAMAEGRLGYQRGHSNCQYRYKDGGCCAIGAALPDDLADLADGALDEVCDLDGEPAADTDLTEMLRCGVFAVESDTDRELLSKLQGEHDYLCWNDAGFPEDDFVAALEACEAA